MVAVVLALWTVAPPQAPDSATRARVTQELQRVQESLSRVRGAAYSFRTDLGRASREGLFSRALRMHASCTAGDQAAGRLDSLLTASYPTGVPAGFGREARALRAALAECRREYDTTVRWQQRADSVRAWAPYRLRRLDVALGRYTRAVAEYRKWRPSP